MYDLWVLGDILKFTAQLRMYSTKYKYQDPGKTRTTLTYTSVGRYYTTYSVCPDRGFLYPGILDNTYEDQEHDIGQVS